ncbi:MAG: ketoacyl-ACP synthase III [Syntrophobacterales bacterium]|nr:MAG: ketoacyl-ACP synthase III [Syntrophobacterales bacterium]
MKRIAIRGTGSYLPEKVMTNFDLGKVLDTNDEWVFKRTGIKERRIAAPDVDASDLAKDASLKAMEMGGYSAEDLDLIIMATMTPDTACPAGSNWLEAKLGAHRAVSFDILAACSGFIFALSVAEQYLRRGIYRNALIVASEIMSRTLDWTDRESCILWGDGAGAVVLEAVDSDEDIHEILSTHINTDGAGGENLLLPGGGSRTTPISYESVDKKLHYLKMIKANESVRIAVKYFAEACEEAVSYNGYSISDVKWIIPHQANIRILQSMAKRLNVPMERVYLTIEKFANISSATVPITLDSALRDGSIQAGDLLCLTAFGGGLTWASSLIRW